MTWSRFDDAYDEHEKVQAAWDADRATVGLHVMATTACNRWTSDGVIRPAWLRGVLPESRERRRALDLMVTFGLFDFLPAGQSAEVEDSDGGALVLGPFREDRYVVHDFLERHDSAKQVEARRQAKAEAGRKGGRSKGRSKAQAGAWGGAQANGEQNASSPRAGAGVPSPSPLEETTVSGGSSLSAGAVSPFDNPSDFKERAA